MKIKKMEKLWVAANKIRGAFEIIELYKVMLYGLLFKYLELKKDKFNSYDEKFSLGYLSLTYGKLVDSNGLLEYVSAVEKEFRIEERVLKESLNSAIEKADSENVRIIFEEINSLDVEDEIEIYNIAKIILDRMITSGEGRASGEYCSSESLPKIAAAIIEVEDDMSVYDACCGTGILVNSVANGKGRVFAQDINVSIIGIAAIMTILSGNKIGAVKCADSLYNPIKQNEKYDRIILEPPFGRKYSKEYIMNIPPENCMYEHTSDSRYLFIRHALASLKDNGIAAILVPMGALFSSGSTGSIRQKLVDDNYIEAIIEFPNGMMMPYSSVATALVIIKKNKMNDDIVTINSKDFFIKRIKEFTITDKNIKRITEIYRNREVIEGVSNTITKETVVENGYNLCTTQYVTLKASEGIVVENNRKFIENYEELLQRLRNIDKELDEVRSRFVKEA
ncbi:HsdM family class I SAM-dependent methyltransferase [Anaerobutyricum hallii]|jgi:type I restriction enzyme M protein|uniref:HsdM family class I SAM-dependent methyltransferase n=1 Tax=Anaerobutyricum hallii TaxID=39488 RepID=UPI002430B2B1|nr:N-6 DNA methylase [Anaerobutyricum hallii]